MEKIFDKAEKYLSIAFIFVLPFFVMSVSSNPFTITKLLLAVFFCVAGVIIIGLKTIVTGKLSYRLSVYDIPVLLVGASYLASAVFRTPNKMEAVLLPGTATAVVGGVLIYFIINQLKDKSPIARTLVLSGAVYSLFMILSYLGVFAKIPQLPAFMQARTYTPDGGYLPSAIFLLSILPLGVSSVISSKEIKNRIVYIFVSLLLTAGLSLSVYQMLPGKPSSPRFPSHAISWEISIDALKASPIFGVGPGNYMTAFNRFRSLAFNSTPVWNVKYSTASNFLFTLFTETGLFGLSSYILLFWIFFKDAKKQIRENKLVNWGAESILPILSFALLFLILLFFPATVFITILIFILLSLSAKTHPASVNLSVQNIKDDGSHNLTSSRIFPLLVFLPLIGLSVFVAYRTFNIVRAEFYYKSALESLLANDAQATFNNMRNSVTLNPRVDRYRSTFSRINLILADATARKKDLTDADRTTISQLIQASISEAKASVALNPLRSQNWEVLGRTYQSIIPLANGADAYAAQAYQQAVALDPINPQLRVTLGGLYYGAKNYETAVRVFELAVTSKPDLANSHFNLAYAYKEQGKYDPAITQMGLVLGLLSPDSKDYEVAKKALEDFQSKKKSAEVPAPSEELVPPVVPTPAIQPKVDLPEGSEPPEAPITEEGSSETTPTPPVSPTP